MEAMGNFSNVSGDVGHELRHLLDLSDARRLRIKRSALQSYEFHSDHSQPLVHVVMKLASNACPFFFLSMDEVSAQVSQSLLCVFACRNVFADSQHTWVSCEFDDLCRVRNHQDVILFGAESHLEVFDSLSVLQIRHDTFPLPCVHPHSELHCSTTHDFIADISGLGFERIVDVDKLSVSE